MQVEISVSLHTSQILVEQRTGDVTGITWLTITDSLDENTPQLVIHYDDPERIGWFALDLMRAATGGDPDRFIELVGRLSANAVHR